MGDGQATILTSMAEKTGWICLETVNALGERRRRSVEGDGFKGRRKGAACLVPIAGTICSKPLGIPSPQ